VPTSAVEFFRGRRCALGDTPHLDSACGACEHRDSSTLAAGQSSTPQVVTIANVCGLTKLDVQGSNKYRALAAKQKLVVDALANAACAYLQKITPKLTAKQKADLIAGYKAATQTLVAPGWLTHQQADIVKSLAGAL
jgi:hypothetical protein